MTGAAKMIIITSDEDIIRQFSAKKLKNTQIINLDNGKQVTQVKKNEKLSFRTESPKPNSNTDQVHERIPASKPAKKSVDLVCSICGAHAIGFNYDALSCGSCKAFFVRNAYRNMETMNCLTDHGRCLVADAVRPKCKKCRLKRCFDVGMKKELLRNKEKKRRRRKHLQKNRPISSESTAQTVNQVHCLSKPLDESDDIIVTHERNLSNETMDTLVEILSDDDLIIIQSMRSSFLSIFEDFNTQFSCADASDRISALSSWSKFVGQSALHFIRFYRHIPQFENLYADDRFILIKNNLFSLFLISKCFSYKPIDSSCSPDQNEEIEKQNRFYTLCFGSQVTRDAFLNVILLLVQTTKQDPTLLALLLTILIFSQSLSTNDDEQFLKDSLAVNQAQCHYTKLLWNYLISKEGEMQACKHFTELVTIIIRIQSICKTIREFIRMQLMTSNTVDRNIPLTQSFPFIP